jgi:uncharacterized membrane protein YdjX (TVP38/TMEM64 family)
VISPKLARPSNLIAATAAIVLLAIFAVFALFHLRDVLHTIAEWIESMGPLAFFTAMTLIPLAGVPITIFYLAAGAAFDPAVSILGTASALALNHLAAHALGGRALRPLFAFFLRRGRYTLPELGAPGSIYKALLIKLTPGLPFALRGYMMALSGIPLHVFLVVSWPISMAYAMPMILIGDSAEEGRIGPAALAIGAMLLLGLLTLFVRDRLGRRRARLEGRHPKTDKA